MKKLISLRIQKVIMFIPFFNIFILFIWYYNTFKTSNSRKILLKAMIPIGIVLVCFSIINNLLSEPFLTTNYMRYIRNFIMLYLLPFTLGYVLIKYQKKTIFKK